MVGIPSRRSCGRSRYTAQLVLSVVGLAAAFAAVVALAEKGYGTARAHIAAMARSPWTAPRSSCRARSCWCRSVAVFTFRRAPLDPKAHGNQGSTSFRRPGLRGARRRPGEGRGQAGFISTEVFPLLLFAVGGMLVFPPRRPADALRRA